FIYLYIFLTFFFNSTPTTVFYTLSLHDALPISRLKVGDRVVVPFTIACGRCFFCERQLWSLCDNSNPNAWMAEKLYGFSGSGLRSEEHTSELQSRFDLVCRLLLEKKKINLTLNERDHIRGDISVDIAVLGFDDCKRRERVAADIIDNAGSAVELTVVDIEKHDLL